MSTFFHFYPEKGDSGGPLFTKEGNRYTLAGIVSYGGADCNGINPLFVVLFLD
jgi:secreted trypsin-like serine protease